MTSPVWHTTRVFERNIQSDKRIIVNRGGTRSSKTYSLSQLFVLELLNGINPGSNKVLSVVRKTLPALKASVMRDIITILQSSGYYEYVKHNKTENTIEYGSNLMEFFSLDNEQKIRGRKRTHLLLNEANEVSYDEWKQLIFRTTGRAYIDFNPSDPNVWIKTELEDKRAVTERDVEVIVSTYTDNHLLEPSIVREIEILKDADPFYWAVFGCGEYGAIKGVVFDNWQVCDKIPEGASLVGYGLDFGFTNDPTATVCVYKQDGKLWVDEVLYERGLTNQDIAARLTDVGISRNTEIIADSAEPKSIEEIYRHGFNIKPAEKGADSINASIDILRQYPLMITARSVNLIKELKTYKWKVDKNGNILNEPVDFNNHAIDALRYVALSKLKTTRVGKYHVLRV